MADYISREYTVENMENYPWDTEHDKNAAIHLVRELVPAADVVEVVRCKDCKLMCHDEHGYWCINDYQACLDPEKDYCSRAARRADNGCQEHKCL